MFVCRRSYYLLVAITQDGFLKFEEDREESAYGAEFKNRNFLNGWFNNLFSTQMTSFYSFCKSILMLWTLVNLLFLNFENKFPYICMLWSFVSFFVEKLQVHSQILIKKYFRSSSHSLLHSYRPRSNIAHRQNSSAFRETTSTRSLGSFRCRF